MINLRLPNINGATVQEQVAQMRSYLHQLVGELQWALQTRGETSVSSVVVRDVAAPSSVGADFIVAEGEDGIWHYRKWNSGTAECWAQHPLGSCALSSANGSLYGTEEWFSKEFPSGLFEESPTLNLTAQTSLDGGCVAIKTIGETTPSGTCRYAPLGISPQTVEITIAIFAIGRWK